ncbi:hypothetical protein SAMN05421761_10284 [Belliella pelovolcani]|uniref:Uncharacterized protein n=1 Tax=Belliella pelovolcani TaxID=529505 RepID=A0A1N7KHN6_9BACT|nr:hypothetical protein SAMN05421761_10284 [Belliella pelovolcani]
MNVNWLIRMFCIELKNIHNFLFTLGQENTYNLALKHFDTYFQRIKFTYLYLGKYSYFIFHITGTL